MVRFQKGKVSIAMSSGVDSSVAAALLKRAGYEVSGVFMRLHDLPQSKESERRAQKVARILGIPFSVLDLRREFKDKVIRYFLNEYKAGRTPNPCVICNKEIKFGSFFKKALRMKADFIATGHYACLRRENRNPKLEILELLRAKDKEKDQSYFLWKLGQKELQRTMFPLGGLTKKQVKDLAKKLRLPPSKAPESQEICFVRTTANDFLKRNIRQKPGDIIDENGKAIGRHKGLVFYTIGQRKGIELPGGPYFVLDKNQKKNALIVTKNKKNLLNRELSLTAVNWISGKFPKFPLKVWAKIRYRSNSAQAVIYKAKNGFKMRFTRPQKAITPGQSAVFYLPVRQAGHGQKLLGGGIIR